MKNLSGGKVIVLILILLSPLFCVYGADGGKKKPVVYFSAITLYHPIVMYQKYQPLMDYLSANTSYSFVLKMNKDYDMVTEYMDKKEVRLALLGGITYVLAKERIPVIPILKPKNSAGGVDYRSIIIVKKNSSIERLDMIKGRRMVFPSRLSTSGYLLPLYGMMQHGIKLRDLSKTANLRYHDSVAREVLKGNYDVGAIIDSVAYKYLPQGLKIIWMSEPIPSLPIVVRADEDPAFIKEVRSALLRLDYKKPRDREVMSSWDDELKFGFAEAADSDYDKVRQMMNELKKYDSILYK